jgi:hypothetical protein
MSDELTQLLEQAARTDDGLNKENKITIIAWGGDLDRIWPTLILSTTPRHPAWRRACSSRSGGCSRW